MYKDFAYIYDELMQNVNYEKWTNYIESIFEEFGLKPKSIVDLACGTGEVTINLAKRSYEVLGIDISEDMLEVAREKTRLAGFRIPYVCQNMAELEIHKPVDAFTCMCDGFNYLLDRAELKKTFKKVFTNLNPGGILIFDVSSYYKLSSILGNNIMADTDKNISLIWCNKFNKESQILQMDLTFFTRHGNHYLRSDESHMQRAYLEEEIKGLLDQCNFSQITSFAPFELVPPKKRSQRIFFAALKK